MINAYSLYVVWLVRFVASSPTAGDTSEPTDTLGSTETAGTGTASTSGDVTATSGSTIGCKPCVIYNYYFWSLIMLFMCSKHLQSGNFLSFWALVAWALTLISICYINDQRILAIRFMTCSFCSIFHHRRGYQWTNGYLGFDRDGWYRNSKYEWRRDSYIRVNYRR